MEREPVRILHIEDNPSDARLVREMLAGASRDGSSPVSFALTHITCLGDALAALAAGRFDLVLADLTLPDSAGAEIVGRLRRAAPDVPVVVLSGVEDNALALQVTQEGARDYLVKGYIDRNLLTRAIRYALECTRATAALHQSETRYRSLYASMREGVALHRLVCDPAGRPVDYVVLDVNPAFESITGIPRAQAAGAKASELYQTAEPPFLEIYARVALTGKPFKFESAFAPMGKIFAISVFAPEIGMFATIFEDITEHRRAETALAEERNLLHTLIDNLPDTIYAKDTAGRYIFKNLADVRLMGAASVEEVIGKTDFDYYPPEMAARFTADDQAVIRSGQPLINREEPLLTAQGSQRWLLTTKLPWRDRQGQIAGLVGIGHDITERKRVAEALRESQDRLMNIVETVPDGILQLNRDGQITFANEAAEGILGITRDQIVERSYDDHRWRITALDGSPVPQEAQPFARVMQTDRPVYNVEHALEHPDGARVCVSINAAPSHDAAGRFTGTVVTISDITERKQAEQEIQRRAEQFTLLYDAGLALNRVLEPRQQLETIFAIALKAVHADRVDFFRYDPARQALRLEMTHHYAGEVMPQVLEALSFPLGREKGLVGWVGQQRRTLYLPEVHADLRWIVVDPEIRSAIWVPLEHEQQLLGVLCVSSVIVNAFSADDQRLLELLASQVAVALDNTRLFEETRQRLIELEAVNQVSTALRGARTLDEMLPRLLDITLEALHAAQGNIRLYDDGKGELRAVVARGYGVEAGASPLPPEKPGEGIAGTVFATGRPYIASELDLDLRLAEALRQRTRTGTGGAVVPLRAGDTVIGTFGISVPGPRELTASEVRLLTTLSEIAGTAIQRTSLNEQTERRLQHLIALSDIDRAIISNFDLRFNLTTILNHVTTQLGVAAADVLLFDASSQMLKYGAAGGFRTPAIESTQLRLGEGCAGRAAQEQRVIYIANLAENHENLLAEMRLAGETFGSYYGLPLIAKGELKGVLEVFHHAPLEPDAEWLDFLNALAKQTVIAIDNATLFDSLQQSNIELAQAYDATIEGWSRALDLRDRETEGHTQRVTDLVVTLARAFGLSGDELVQVRWGALLHDIGKMGVPDGILLKPGALTDEEWVVMKQHPVAAYEMLSPIHYLRAALDIPYGHHERWDGTGYPLGLQGEQIPLVARIFAVVDVWDALRSDRPYRRAWSHEKVVQYLREQAGTHFDPQVVRAFLALLASDPNRDLRTVSDSTQQKLPGVLTSPDAHNCEARLDEVVPK